jgi:phospholipase/carboxylesterase
MRVQGDTELITLRDWVLRVHPGVDDPRLAARGRSPRLILLLHGWTGDENSMWVFTRNFSTDYWVIAPRAPHVSEPGGFSWRPGPAGQRDSASLEEFRPAAHALIGLVDAYAAQRNLLVPQFDVIGFSQGAALANTLALLHPSRIGRAGALAGFIPGGSESVIVNQPLKGKHFFVAHGEFDEMVKIEYAYQAVKMLERAGAIVTFCVDKVGHKLGANCLIGLQNFFI